MEILLLNPMITLDVESGILFNLYLTVLRSRFDFCGETGEGALGLDRYTLQSAIASKPSLIQVTILSIFH